MDALGSARRDFSSTLLAASSAHDQELSVRALVPLRLQLTPFGVVSGYLAGVRFGGQYRYGTAATYLNEIMTAWQCRLLRGPPTVRPNGAWRRARGAEPRLNSQEMQRRQG